MTVTAPEGYSIYVGIFDYVENDNEYHNNRLPLGEQNTNLNRVENFLLFVLSDIQETLTYSVGITDFSKSYTYRTYAKKQ